jgi:glycosyltransferase involved in cell wall biosynthesis
MKPLPRLRLAVVISHPTQYYSPWFRWLALHGKIEIRVFYLWKFGVAAQRDPQFKTVFAWDVDLLSGYESEFVPNVARNPGAESFWGFRNPGLAGRLADWRPDAILLFGYKWAAHLRTIAWAWLHRVPIVFRGDSHFLGRPDPGWTRVVPLRFLFRRFAAVTYAGAANRAYFERLGVPSGRLFFAPHAVNGELFSPGDPRIQEATKALRGELGLSPSTRVVVFAGKLIAAKQPRELLEAFIALQPRDAALVLVGEGEEKDALRALALRAPPGTVHFLPFANQSEMPSRYLLGDVFALPSRGLYETWGLAVNEAMHMGTPCLVSDRVGCQQDLVTDGETGWVFRADEPGALQRALAVALSAIGSPTGRERFRAAATARVAGYTYAQTTEGLLAALESLKGKSL